MATIFDVSRYILGQFPLGITNVKLQKLNYFAQAWSLAVRDKPLFDEDFRAWRFGPVSPELYRTHARTPSLDQHSLPYGDQNQLSPAERAVVDAVIQNYGALSGIQLSDISHQYGAPWYQVRKEHGLGPTDPSSAIIPKDLIKQFYRDELSSALYGQPVAANANA